MRSHLTDDFRNRFDQLPDRIKRLARKNYKIWKVDPSHPSLEFKRVSKKLTVYSVRVGIGWRATGIRRDQVIIWFWIGSHAEYDKLLKKL